jgi:hypothetical protein
LFTGGFPQAVNRPAMPSTPDPPPRTVRGIHSGLWPAELDAADPQTHARQLRAELKAAAANAQDELDEVSVSGQAEHRQAAERAHILN